MTRLSLLIGENGCGKSTELSRVSKGRIDLLRFIPPDRHPQAKLFEFVHQAIDRLVVSRSISSALETPLVAAGLAPALARSFIASQLELFGFTHLLSRSFDNLSGGEDQVVAVLSAVARTQSGLIVDDPFGMLDSRRAAAVESLLASYSVLVQKHASRDAEVIISATETNISQVASLRGKFADSLILTIPSSAPVASMNAAINAFVDVCETKEDSDFIELSEFSLSVESEQPLHEQVSCKFETGALYLLTGDNGTGKSLLLRALASRLSKPVGWSGKLTCSAGPINPRASQKADRFKYVMVPQACHWLLAGEIPASIIMKVLSHSREGAQAAESLLDCHLIWRDRVTTEASVGEVRFVTHLVAALCALRRSSVRWLLADEPDAFLDSKRAGLLSALYTLLVSNGVGVIVATHNPSLYSACQHIHLRSARACERSVS